MYESLPLTVTLALTGYVQIWRHIKPAVPNADVSLDLGDGSGTLHLRLDWNAGTSPVPRTLGARGRTASTGSTKGPDTASRFSMMKRKEKVEKEGTRAIDGI